MVGSDAPIAEANGAPVPSLGGMLRDARVAQDLTLEQLSTEFRIEARQLQALEENRFEQIGVPVFVKGYIRQYAHRFGLNLADLLVLYYEQAKLAEVELRPNRTIKLRDDRQISHWIVAALVLLSVGVGAAVWWWNGGSFGVVRTPNVPVAEASAVARSVPTPALATPEVVAIPPTPEQFPAEAPPVEAAGQEPVQAATPAAPPPTVQVSAQGDAGAADEEESASAVGLAPLEFTFSAESWAEVTDTRGERLLYGLISAGRRTVRGEPPFSILLGNATAVELRVDGVPYPIPSGTREDSLVRFSVAIAED